MRLNLYLAPARLGTESAGPDIAVEEQQERLDRMFDERGQEDVQVLQTGQSSRLTRAESPR